MLLSTDPEIDLLGRPATTAGRLLDEAIRRVAQAAGGLRATLTAALPAHGTAMPPGGHAGDLEGWRWEAAELNRVAGLLRRRTALLAQWRERVPKGGASLQRELVKYADVVAATCIGTVSTDLLAELRFAVAIVDEAGQISLPNLLVPLVRAERAVLVGDHRQLPPYLEEEVRNWAAGVREDPGQIHDLLIKSGFEMLYGKVGDEHGEMLRRQRRMPIELASFVSRTFYNNRLETEHPGGGGDPIFRSPFAMVSTSDVPEAERAETRSTRVPGYVNRLEAELIVELIARLRNWYPDWGVILPYRAQVDLVRRRLSAALGDPDRIVDCVGTVDSFQGGERELIVVGFVRSNARHEVGFLDELRRLNVAISRAPPAGPGRRCRLPAARRQPRVSRRDAGDGRPPTPHRRSALVGFVPRGGRPVNRIIYPVHRAIENAAAQPSMQPLRVFGVLWPLWRIEITANVTDGRDYELLDSFVTRAVGESAIDSAVAIADFLGLPPATVNGCVRYLATIGHLLIDGDRLTLTESGRRSLREDRRYETREARQHLLFDQFTASPLPRTHYANAVRLLDRPSAPVDEVGGTRFTQLFAATGFRPEIVEALARPPDRTAFNVPAELDNVQMREKRHVFLPAYLVRTTQGLLAYTAVADGRDTYLESLCARAPDVTLSLPPTDIEEVRHHWTGWLRDKHGGRGRLRQRPNGVWRASLPRDAFAKGSRQRLGSYVVNNELFLQLWCDDEPLRRDAMLDRALRIARSSAFSERMLSDLAEQYELPATTVDVLRDHASRTGQDDPFPA